MAVGRKPHRLRNVIVTLACGSAIALLGVAASSAVIAASATGQVYSTVATLPHRRVGLLLGCSKRLADGRGNLFFRHRIAAAADLFRERKIDYILASGDNHRKDYDESSDMKQSLIEAGVPADRIYCDFAGFRTLDSIARAKDVFGQTQLTIISQEFHNQRALYIANHRGIDAIALNAQGVKGYHGFLTICREQLARVRTVLDVCVLGTKPKFLGPKVVIGHDPQVRLD